MGTFAVVMQEMMKAHDVVGSEALAQRLHDEGYRGGLPDLNTNVVFYMHGVKKPPATFLEAFADALALNEPERARLRRAYQQ